MFTKSGWGLQLALNLTNPHLLTKTNPKHEDYIHNIDGQAAQGDADKGHQ